MVGPFGGVTAACLLQAPMQHPQRHGDPIAASATAVFALRRETWSMPEAAPRIGRPAWTHHCDMRFAHGGMPDAFDSQQQPDSISQVWVRDEPPRPLDFVALVSLCDSFFPRIFVRRRKATPIGTVSLTTCFDADAAMLRVQADRHVLGVARALNFRNGDFDQSAEVWSDDYRD